VRSIYIKIGMTMALVFPNVKVDLAANDSYITIPVIHKWLSKYPSC
jgi:hypothetical protein